MATQQISKNIKYYRPIAPKPSHLIISKPGTLTVPPVNLPVPTSSPRPPVTQHPPVFQRQSTYCEANPFQYPVNDNVNFEPFKYDSFQYDIPYNYMLESNVQSGFNQVTFKNVTNAENERDQREQKATAINENQTVGKGERKRKAADDNVERWSDEETSQLLYYLEENYDQYQQGKKSGFYNTISSKVLKSKSAESIKGRLRRLLDNEEEKEREIKTDDKKENKRAIKKTKNNIEVLVEMMGNISQSKVQISEQRLKMEQEKMERDHKFQMEKLEVEKKNGSMSESNQECYMK
ncbi:unnamed protein product [Rhizophagus irregularis]|nr:unnamed protein product [Rhizophagus irregularis]